MNENQLIEHEVKIDEYTRVILSIPRRIDAAELKALMVKTGKLFSMSEIKLQGADPTKEVSKSINRTSKFHWTPEQNSFLMDCIKQGMSANDAHKAFNQRFNINVAASKVIPKYYAYKKKWRKM